MAGPKSDLITVSVPPESGSIQVLRAVTASVAARMNMPFDGIEDLRLAVAEACAWLLGLAGGATSMTLRLRLDPPERPRVLAPKMGRLGDLGVSPIACIALAGGPMNLILQLSQTSAKCAFSARNP